MGIIGYRDYSDDEQFVVHDFTSDKVAFVRCLVDGSQRRWRYAGSRRHAKALSEPSWGDAKHRGKKTVAKIIFHIGDATTARRVHDPADRIGQFPREERIARTAKFARTASSKIDYYFAQVKSNGGKGTVMHRMATKFKEAYDSR